MKKILIDYKHKNQFQTNVNMIRGYYICITTDETTHYLHCYNDEGLLRTFNLKDYNIMFVDEFPNT